MIEIKAAIFDLDGLLLDTEGIFDRLVQRYAIETTGKEIPANDFKSLRINQYGRTKEDSAILLHEALGLSSEFPPEHYIKWRQQHEHNMFPTAKLLPGASDVIHYFHQRGIPIAIATSSTVEAFRLKTSRHRDLFDLFGNHVITGDQIAKGKPDPESFLKASLLLGINPLNCVVFEDAPSGIQAAKAANMFVIAVPHPWLSIDSVTGADIILKSLQDFKPSHLGFS